MTIPTEVMQANVLVHTKMIDAYNNEPHFRPENQARVRSVLENLKFKTGGEKLLDIGCGTGFIINLAKDLFQEIHGVDITPAMLSKVDLSTGNITLHNIPAENLPFPMESFDVVTAYAFLHHLEDYIRVIEEVFRVLKVGGLFYVDLEPNKLFWLAMQKLEQERHASSYSFVVEKEIAAALHTDEHVQAHFDIDQHTFNKAEYTKSILGGIDPHQFQQDAISIGFSECQVYPQWFLGQGSVMHGQSFETANVIESFLLERIPLTNHLFKYLRFILRK